jgi:hypothetical protein
MFSRLLQSFGYAKVAHVEKENAELLRKFLVGKGYEDEDWLKEWNTLAEALIDLDNNGNLDVNWLEEGEPTYDELVKFRDLYYEQKANGVTLQNEKDVLEKQVKTLEEELQKQWERLTAVAKNSEDELNKVSALFQKDESFDLLNCVENLQRENEWAKFQISGITSMLNDAKRLLDERPE